MSSEEDSDEEFEVKEIVSGRRSRRARDTVSYTARWTDGHLPEEPMPILRVLAKTLSRLGSFKSIRPWATQGMESSKRLDHGWCCSPVRSSKWRLRRPCSIISTSFLFLDIFAAWSKKIDLQTSVC